MRRELSGPWPTLLGLLTTGLGILAIASPLISRNALLTAVAAGALVAGALLLLTRSDRLWQLCGLIWIALGVAAVVWPDHPLPTLSVLAGSGLLASGAVGCLTSIRKVPRAWGPSLVGVALTIAGIAVIGWKDISILVATLVLGIYLLTLGVGYLLRSNPGSPGPVWGTWRTIGAGLLVALSVVLLAVGGWFRVTASEPTPFYDVPSDVPAEPGQLLRAEPYTAEVPDNARAWRILYTTTRDDQTPAIASGIVMVPIDAGDEPFQVISWAHGTTGFDPSCAPSLLDSSLESGAFFLTSEVIDQGWALVATDYMGLGTEGPHPYLIGDAEGRSVLDATRAARQLEELSLSDETVIWGHSQGGHAALWAGQLAPTYAPDAGVIGVAALAPASNLPALITGLESNITGPLFGSFVVAAYAETYDDVEFEDVVAPRNQVLMRELAHRCLGGREILLTLGEVAVLGMDVWSGDPMSGSLGRHIQANIPLDPIEAPLLIAQGEDDSLVLPAGQADYVAQRCDLGTTLEYRTYAGRDHVPLVEEDSPLIPELIQWTQDRWNGDQAISTC